MHAINQFNFVLLPLQANAATRMHPMEWNSGLAAGLGASLMASQRLTSHQLLQQVDDLQAKLVSWTTLDWHHGL
jgi:hypothetical protein